MSTVTKHVARHRRARKTRQKIRELGRPRLSVHRTLKHIYASVSIEGGSRIVAAVSTLGGDFSANENAPTNGGNVFAAREVGRLIAEKALKAGIKQVAFDRSGFKYHGRVKALAEAARETGLEF